MSSRRPTPKKKPTGAAVATPKSNPLPPLEPIVIPPSESFKEAIIQELRAMEQAKKDAHRLPDHTVYRELEKHLSSALNALYKEGRIIVGNTVNDKYIRITENNLD